MAFTSDLSNAGSDDLKYIAMTVSGRHSQKKLPNLKGDDYLSLKGDLWKLNLHSFFGFSGCVEASSVQAITIVNGGTDGWNIESIVTYLISTNTVYVQSSVDFNIYQWIDNQPRYEQYSLTLTV